MSNQIAESNKKDRRLSIFVLYVVMTFTVYILPYTKFVLPYILVALLMLVSIPFVCRKKVQWTKYVVALVCTGILIMFVLMIKELTFVNGINEFIRHVRFFMPALWAVYAIEYCNKKQKQFILLAFVAVTAFVFYRTSVALAENAWIARLLAESTTTSSLEINSYRLKNVGGFEFSYMIGVITIGAVWLAFNAKKKYVKVICAILTVVCYYYIIQTMYTTLLILTTVCLVLMVILYIKNTMFRVLWICAAVVFLFLLPSVSLKLSDLFGDSLLSDKFYQIHIALVGGGVESLGSRPGMLLDALTAFIENPIWGETESEGNYHSLLFQIMAIYGLLGLSSFIISLVGARKIIVSILKKKNRSVMLFDLSMIYVVILSVLNPIGYVFEVCIAVFFIVPLFIDYSTETFSKDEQRDF